MMQVPLLDLHSQYRDLETEIREAVQRVFDSKTFILGPEVRAFEERLDLLLSPARCLGVSNGTDALLMALMALNIGTGDEVIVPPFTFFATAAVVLRLGANPVFADIDPESFNLDPSAVEAAITPRTKAVIPVHLYGQCAPMTTLRELAARRGLRVIEDAAQALGATHNGRPACTHGDIACVSFYPTKNLGAAGEAGLVATADDDLFEKCRILRNQGMEPRYEHRYLGGNFRMDAIQGAVLAVKLSRLKQWNAARSRHADQYNHLLADCGVRTPTVAEANTHVYHQYTIRCPHRDALRSYLAERGIATEVHYPIPLHLQPCLSKLGHKQGEYPVAEQAAREVLCLPIFPELTDDQINHVARMIREFMSSRNNSAACSASPAPQHS